VKIKKGFSLRKVSNHYVVVPLEEATNHFKGVIHLNETSAFLWQALEKGMSNRIELTKVFMKEYNIDKETASKDVDDFLKVLIDANVIEG